MDALLADINPTTVDEYVEQRRTESVSEHTISLEVTKLCTVLKVAKRRGAYFGDIDTLRPEDLHVNYEPRDRTLSREEVVRLLAQLEPARGAFVAVCIALGCRLSEAFKLTPADIDMDRGRVFIGGTKTKESKRWVPILSIFRSLLEAAAPHLPIAPWQNLGRDIKSACKRAGIAPCSPNDFRRTHATLLKEAGVDSDVVRRLLGHTTTNLVDTVYGKPTTESLAGLAEERLSIAAPVIRFSQQLRDSDLEHLENVEKLAPPRRFERLTNALGKRSSGSVDSTCCESPGEYNGSRAAVVGRKRPTDELLTLQSWALAFAAHKLGLFGQVSQ